MLTINHPTRGHRHDSRRCAALGCPTGVVGFNGLVTGVDGVVGPLNDGVGRHSHLPWHLGVSGRYIPWIVVVVSNVNNGLYLADIELVDIMRLSLLIITYTG